MDLLRTAVVDIITLVATCRALKWSASAAEALPMRKLRRRLRREIKCGAVAYIDVLAKSQRGSVDVALLTSCRVNAEALMPLALEHQVLLSRIMASEAGSLDGLAVARQDLFRLAHMAIHLGAGMATLQESGLLADFKAADRWARRLRRRFRRALDAYARVSLRTESPNGRLLAKARGAALAEIGPPGASDAERLADLEVGDGPARTLIRLGVTRSLQDLALDWQDPQSHVG